MTQFLVRQISTKEWYCVGINGCSGHDVVVLKAAEENPPGVKAEATESGSQTVVTMAGRLTANKIRRVVSLLHDGQVSLTFVDA